MLQWIIIRKRIPEKTELQIIAISSKPSLSPSRSREDQQAIHQSQERHDFVSTMSVARSTVLGKLHHNTIRTALLTTKSTQQQRQQRLCYSILTKRHEARLPTRRFEAAMATTKVDYSTLKTPELCYADFCLLPVWGNWTLGFSVLGWRFYELCYR